jgi:hypothetical protein
MAITQESAAELYDIVADRFAEVYERFRRTLEEEAESLALARAICKADNNPLVKILTDSDDPEAKPFEVARAFNRGLATDAFGDDIEDVDGHCYSRYWVCWERAPAFAQALERAGFRAHIVGTDTPKERRA